jgi:hypothetical protein
MNNLSNTAMHDDQHGHDKKRYFERSIEMQRNHEIPVPSQSPRLEYDLETAWRGSHRDTSRPQSSAEERNHLTKKLTLPLEPSSS